MQARADACPYRLLWVPGRKRGDVKCHHVEGERVGGVVPAGSVEVGCVGIEISKEERGTVG